MEKIFVSVEIAKYRYKTCKSCEHFLPTFPVCQKCGCFMPAKVTLHNSSCPVGKWGSSAIDETITQNYTIED